MFRKPIPSVLVTLLSLATLSLSNLAKAQSFFAVATYAEVVMPDQTNTFTYSYFFGGSYGDSSTSGTGTIDYQFQIASSFINQYYTVIQSGGSASPTGYASTTDTIGSYLQIQNSGTTDLTYDVQVYTSAYSDAQATSAFTDFNDAGYGDAYSYAYLYNPNSTGSPSGYLSSDGANSYALRGEFPFTFSDSPFYTLTISAGTTQYLDLYSSAFGFAQSTVPEPSSIALIVGMGLSGAVFLARRRKQARQAA